MSFAQLLAILERNISSEIFFNALLSDEDLSKLLCTCRGMKEMILKWKTIFDTKYLKNDKMLGNLIKHYSHNIKKITFHYKRKSLTTIDEYRHLALLHSNLIELSINDHLILPRVISSSFQNLTSLSLFYFHQVSSEDMDSLSKLTNKDEVDNYWFESSVWV
jgi:hypothetical protein